MPTVIAQPNRDVFPNTDDAFLSFCENMNTVGAASANPYVAGVPSPFGLDYTAIVTAYSAALAAATNPSTRTAVTVAAKNDAKLALEIATRSNASYLQTGRKSGLVTDAEIVDLGLRVPSARTPIPAPSVAPVVSIVGMGVGTTRVEARDPDSPDRRRLPVGTVGVQTELSFGDGSVKEMAPFSSKSGFDLASDPTRVGSMATIRCRFQNAKGETGPWSTSASYVVT